MIAESFDRRTMANMEVALERACLLLPTGSEKHWARRIIANKILECANRGDTTLSRLTEAGYAAAMQLTTTSGQLGNSFRKTESRQLKRTLVQQHKEEGGDQGSQPNQR
jgi:hypothetical protein